jgi:hypothetical protein
MASLNSSKSLTSLLRIYRKLPYIIHKNYSSLYLIPQPPLKPQPYKMNFMH